MCGDGGCGVQERNVVEVAKDVAKIFGLPESKITYVKDRAFNDQCVTLHSPPAAPTSVGTSQNMLTCL